MKNVLLIWSLLFVFAANAQRPRGNAQNDSPERIMKDATAEEMASLRSKKLTLYLDLTATQQSQVNSIELVRAKAAKAKMAERKEKNTLTKEEVIALRNERLDAAIAYKREMKAVLNATQYEKWEKRLRQKGRNQKARAKRGMKKGKIRH